MQSIKIEIEIKVHQIEKEVNIDSDTSIINQEAIEYDDPFKVEHEIYEALCKKVGRDLAHFQTTKQIEHMLKIDKIGKNEILKKINKCKNVRLISTGTKLREYLRNTI